MYKNKHLYPYRAHKYQGFTQPHSHGYATPIILQMMMMWIIIMKITVSLKKIRETRVNIPCRDAQKEISKSSVSFAYWTHEGHGNLISQPILF